MYYLNMKKDFNWPLAGHDNIKKYLEKNISAGKLSHAYIFAGQAHLGKKTMAVNFIRSFLCQEEKVPCNKCSTCRDLKKGIYPDFYEISVLEGKKNIGIEQIRDLISQISDSSFSGNYKIIFIKNAEKMTLSAANSLLKGLEEPAKKTIFILITDDIESVPLTIRSRAQVINFLPVNPKEIENYLIKTGAGKDLIKEAVRLSQGRPGLAVGFIQDSRVLKEYKEFSANFLNFLSGSLSERFDYIEKSIGKQKNFQEKALSADSLLDVWLNVLRDLLLAKRFLADRLSNVSARDKLNFISAKYSDRKIIYFIDKTNEAKVNLNNSVNPQLIVENLALNF